MMVDGIQLIATVWFDH